MADLTGTLQPVVAPYFTRIAPSGGSDSSALTTAVTAAGDAPLYISGTLSVTSSVTVSCPIVDTLDQIFTLASAAYVVIDNGMAVRPEWFGPTGRTIRAAVDSLPATGGVIQLLDAVYPPNYDFEGSTQAALVVKITAGTASAGVDYLSKPNVFIRGAKLPTYNSGKTALENGTVIQGTFYSYATGFQWDNIGVDVGSAVCTAEYAGDVVHDAFGMTQMNYVAPLSHPVGIKGGGLRTLGASATAAAHGCLIEAIDSGNIDYVENYYSAIGTVIKASNVEINQVVNTGSQTYGLIIKGDSQHGDAVGIQVGRVSCYSSTGAVELGSAVYLDTNATVGFGVDGVTIGEVYAQLKTYAVSVNSRDDTIDNVTIGSVISDRCTYPVDIGSSTAAGTINNLTIDTLIGKTGTTAIAVDSNITVKTIRIGQAILDGFTTGYSVYGRISFGHTDFLNISGNCLQYENATAQIMVGTHTQTSSSTLWNLDPTLGSSWANIGGGKTTFQMYPEAGRIVLKGTIDSGTTANIIASGGVSANVRSAESTSIPCTMDVAGTLSPSRIVTDSAGIMTLSGWASTTTAYLDGVSWSIPY